MNQYDKLLYRYIKKFDDKHSEIHTTEQNI